MASTGHTAFSHDGKHLAICGTDGKLKIYEAGSSRLKQEFVPNLHLSSPYSVLGWIVVTGQSTNPPASPCKSKKRKKRSITEDVEHREIVAMGSANGTVTLYDISTSSISDELQNGHISIITALTWSSNAGLFTAAEDKQIVGWDLQEKSVKCKWKYGNGKVTSLALLPDGKSILSGEKKIIWWSLDEIKLKLKVFDGHAGQVNTLQCLKINEQSSYVFSSAHSSSDNYLSVWSLDQTKKDTSSVAALALPDEALSFSARFIKDSSQILILSVTRSGDAQLFKYQPNGASTKLIKPSLKVSVAADAGQKESVQKIPIITGRVTEDAKMLLAYGSFLGLTIEKVVPDFSDTSSDDKPPLQCLIRTDLSKSKGKKEEVITKIKQQDTDGKVEYLGPAEATSKSSALKRNKSGAGSQLPLKDRLENLSLDAETSTPNKSQSKGENMAQLLLQGLHSGDETLLSHCLYIKKESVIKNTVARMPVQAIVPLLKKVTSMLQGKTYLMSIGVLWLQEIISTHAATLISLPNNAELLSPILNYIDAYSKFFPEVTKTLGRSKLITGQLSQRIEKQEKDVTEECLLVYQDQDSSDEDMDINKVEFSSDSGDSDNWEEASDQEPMNVDMCNGKSDDEASICSSD